MRLRWRKRYEEDCWYFCGDTTLPSPTLGVAARLQECRVGLLGWRWWLASYLPWTHTHHKDTFQGDSTCHIGTGMELEFNILLTWKSSLCDYSAVTKLRYLQQSSRTWLKPLIEQRLSTLTCLSSCPLRTTALCHSSEKWQRFLRYVSVCSSHFSLLLDSFCCFWVSLQRSQFCALLKLSFY